MQGTLINQGLELMLFGMGTVIVFLSVLVLATMLMSALVQRFLPEEVAAAETSGKNIAVDTALLAVITAALHQHRKTRGKH